MDIDYLTKFDFFVLTAHGAAEHAIFRYLELHPDIFPVAADAGDVTAATSYTSRVKHMFRDRVRTGWVFADMHLLQTNLHNAQEITRRVKGELLIQLVRDPVRLLLSLYNNSLKVSYLQNKPPYEVGEFFVHQIQTALYHRAGSALAPHFKRWEIIDTTDITGAKTAGTMRHLFGLLGVPADEAVLRHPALTMPQNDLVQSMLRIGILELEVFGTRVRCMLQTDGSLDATGSRTPVAAGEDARFEIVGGIIAHVPPEIQTALKTSTLKVMVETRDWAAIHPKIRALIVRDNELGKAYAAELMPRLLSELNSRTSSPRLTAEDLGKDMIGRVKAMLAPDVRELFRKDPSLRDKWDICGDI